MHILKFSLLLVCLIKVSRVYPASAWNKFTTMKIEEYQNRVEEWLKELNTDLSKFNSLGSILTWKLSTVPDETTAQQALELGVARNKWKNNVCKSIVKKQWLKPDQQRKLYLLCRGPRFSEELSRSYMKVMGELTRAYNSEICFSQSDANEFYALGDEYQILNQSIIYQDHCVYGEPDLERLMKRKDLNPSQLKWVWLTWHNFVGPQIKTYYHSLVDIENIAANNNEYNDIGEVWREELEIPNLEKAAFNLYEQIKPLYVLLHAVVRHKLFQKYGSSVIDLNGHIPIHLLGNMWGQDWSALMDLFVPSGNTINLEENLRSRNWSVIDMVLKAEDMYTSLGLPKMTETFWKHSIFEESENTTMCHGTAANMFAKDDYRILLCAKITSEDFYVVHHEMGHIEYYMAYEDQPSLFQDGASSAFHESIGDAIMHAVMVPQHLHRLKLITDENLFDENLDLILLLQQALSKIPEIPFSLIIDKYRWDIFKGKLKPDTFNNVYWKLNKNLRGIIPPEQRNEQYFDAGGKFHIPDNTPYIRYFLSSILQMQIFNSLCEISVYGKPNDELFEENSNHLPLHRCDIYGSKQAGSRLKKMMQQGSSQHWSETLKILTGKDYISAKPLLQYYNPLYEWLKQYVEHYNVTVGW